MSSLYNSIQTTTRTRGLTVDLNNFSYGGNTPLYSTFESELNFDTVNHIHANSSEEDIIGYQHDSDSDQESTNKHYPTITPFNNNTTSTNTTHTNTSKSMVLTRQQSNSMSITTSNTSPIPRPNRKRAQSTKFAHITSSSFHHFRIRSITINPSNTMNDPIDDTSYMDDHKHNKTLSTATMNVLKEDEEHDNDSDDNKPRHRATGTVIIDGHPPLPILPNDISINSSTKTKTETGHVSNGSASISKTKYVIIPKKKRKTVGFASNVVDPKRKYIEKEILETEETYYRGLYTLLNELIIPMFENNLLASKYKKQCISNLPDLLAFHDKFLTQLVEIYEHQKNKNKHSSFNSISQVFNAQNKEEFINLYLTYIRDYDNILDLFGNTFHNNTKLQIFLKQKRKERKPLTNFLILPVQRVPRYILLLTDLKKHTLPSDNDYKNIESALELVQEIANEINERKRQIENMSQCLQIQEALTDLQESIVKPGREYQKQFVFIKKGHINHQRQFFVFTDIMIVTNHNWRVKDILDIRTVDIKLKPKIQPLKKKKSFRFGKLKNKENKENEYVYDDNKIIDDDKKNNKPFVEFVLLYLNNKPCTYVAKDIHEFIQFEDMVKENRLMLIDMDLAKEKDTSKIREALKEQGVSQANDYQMEINSLKSKRKRGNASADKYVLKQSKSAPIYE